MLRNGYMFVFDALDENGLQSSHITALFSLNLCSTNRGLIGLQAHMNIEPLLEYWYL